MRARIGTAALSAALAAVVLAGFAQWVQSPGSLIVDPDRPSIDYARKNPERALGNDLTTVFLPRFVLVRDHLKAYGRLPAWDPSGFGGRPLIGNPQAGVFYPPIWMAFLQGSLASLGWLTVGHLVWAGIGVYALGRAVGLSRGASVVSGIAFELSPYLLGHVFEGHYPHVWSACWYPWAFRAMILARRGVVRELFLCPVILALCFLCGHPQEWYYLVLALSVWWVVSLIPVLQLRHPTSALFPLFLWGLIVFVGLAIVAVELLPEREAQVWGLRTGAIPLRFINRYQLRPENLLQLFSPFALGRPDDYFGHDNYWECLLSVGLCPLILAVIGIVWNEDRRLVRAWGTLVLVALIFAAGRRLGLFSLAYLTFPGMDRFRVPSRSLFLAALGVSILTGSGMDVLMSRHIGALKGTVRGIVGSLLVVAALVFAISRLGLTTVPAGRVADARGIVLTHSQGLPKDETAAWTRLVLGTRRIVAEPIFAVTLFAMMVVLSMPGKHDRCRAARAYGLGAIATCELVFYAQGLLVCSPADRFTRDDPVCREVRGLAPAESEPLRVAAVESLYDDLRAALAGVEKTNTNDGFQLQHAADVYERLYPYLDPFPMANLPEYPMDGPSREFQKRVARRALNLMGVRAFVTDRVDPWMDLDRDETRAPGDRPVRVWNNPSALPLAYVVPRATRLENHRSLPVEAMMLVDPRDAVLMVGDPLKGAARQPFKPAKWTRNEGDVIGLEVETVASGYLVIGNTWMPGWTAEVDGVFTSDLRGNHCQQVVPIEGAGNHSITLRYAPPGLKVGAWVSILTTVGWGFGGFFWIKSRRVDGLKSHAGRSAGIS